jgi:hypothetical protein
VASPASPCTAFGGAAAASGSRPFAVGEAGGRVEKGGGLRQCQLAPSITSSREAWCLVSGVWRLHCGRELAVRVGGGAGDGRERQ